MDSMIDNPNPNGTADLPEGGDAALEAALRSSAGALPGAPSPELDRMLAERAAAEELLDVAYATVDSPLGPSLTGGFTSKVLQATARIECGSTSRSAGVAAQAGLPRAVRAAGNALG